ncbi:hypothetical protein SNEBB_001241 [Seison nebaliae]|nr:hypothetical protein SNEBB_001241 [Seison nebaliae]
MSKIANVFSKKGVPQFMSYEYVFSRTVEDVTQELKNKVYFAVQWKEKVGYVPKHLENGIDRLTREMQLYHKQDATGNGTNDHELRKSSYPQNKTDNKWTASMVKDEKEGIITQPFRSLLKIKDFYNQMTPKEELKEYRPAEVIFNLNVAESYTFVRCGNLTIESKIGKYGKDGKIVNDYKYWENWGNLENRAMSGNIEKKKTTDN